jgi:hypothetical protein
MRERTTEFKSVVSAGVFVNGYVCLIIAFYLHKRLHLLYSKV